ncbi:hypothetical protein BKP64_11035 [Marinobacter salinus]|uniref:Uncharacterized protein n=1 Tax=Marinobacter salinus TaxID=1874317 RepID=A0A1D9GLZ6_9GAMM|nr:hypothetical protein [Marinobacter salinus]AOY88663.1 hypothetical protein BKP64_11035 [Marinobacter salinus]
MYDRVMKKFSDSYPLLMHQRDDNSFNRFGLEVGPGWYPLIFELFGFVDDMQRATGKAAGISQVKEKFGTLRIYCNLPCAADEQEILETIFASLSVRTCDFCGAPGRLSDAAGWWATRCDQHREISDFVESNRLRERYAEQFLNYERQGIVTEGLVYAFASRSSIQGCACLKLYELPRRLTSLSDGLMSQLTVSECADRDPAELEKMIKGMKDRGKRVAAVCDASDEGRTAIGSRW